MAKLNTLIILVLTIVLPTLLAEAQTACSQKFEIDNIKGSNDKIRFDLKIQSKDIYSGQLVETVNTNQQVVQTFSGQGDQRHTFKNLKNSYYRVILEFKNEPKFLCKERVLMVDLTDSSKTW